MLLAAIGRDAAWIALLVVWLLLPALGKGQLLLINAMRKSIRRVGAQKLQFALLLWAGAEVVIATAILYLVLAYAAEAFPLELHDVVTWVALLEGFAVVGLLAFAALSAWRMALAFPKFDPARVEWEPATAPVESRTSQMRYEQQVALARLSAWVCLLLPTLFVAPFFVIVFGFFGLLGVVTCVAVAMAYRSRRTQLLWVLAVGAEHGFSLGEEVDAYAATAWPRTRQRLRLLADRLFSGIPLSEALEEVPGLVPRFAVVTARVGEQTGTLPQALREAAERETAVMKRARSMPSAPWFIAYYWSMAAITCCILSFLLVYIVPKLKAIFEGFGEELPGLTAAVLDTLSASDALFAIAAPVFGIPSAVLILCAVGYTYGWGNLKVPWLTRWFPRFDVPWILRNLAATVEARRPLTLGLAQMAETHHRRHLALWLTEMESKVAAGGDCWDVFREQKLISVRERDVLQAAARSGNLAWALRYVAETMESAQRRRVQLWLEVARILIVLVVAAVVAVVVVAFFLPLVELLMKLGTKTS